MTWAFHSFFQLLVSSSFRATMLAVDGSNNKRNNIDLLLIRCTSSVFQCGFPAQLLALVCSRCILPEELFQKQSYLDCIAREKKEQNQDLI